MEDFSLKGKQMKEDEDDYHQQIISTFGATGGRFSPEKQITETSVKHIVLKDGGNHLHLKPHREYWVMGSEQTHTDFSVLVEISPKYSNRFVIFCRPGEKIHLKLAPNAPNDSDVCVSIFCRRSGFEESYHELIIDRKDQFYLVAIPTHTYLIRTGMEDWWKSQYNIEVHSGKILELDIDDTHVYYISAPFDGQRDETKCAFVIVNSETTPVQ